MAIIHGSLGVFTGKVKFIDGERGVSAWEFDFYARLRRSHMLELPGRTWGGSIGIGCASVCAC